VLEQTANRQGAKKRQVRQESQTLQKKINEGDLNGYTLCSVDLDFTF
jgi:hypothetical protein